MKKTLLIMVALLAIQFLQAQVFITGTVNDADGVPLIGATVLDINSGRGTVSDVDGKFTLRVDGLPTTLNIAFLGYRSENIDVTTTDDINVTLSENESSLDEVVVVGSRGKARTILSSPVPIDNINAAELKRSGQRTVEQMINYKIPSYNSSNQAISDATAHFDPSELRNMGPSRTLVLVNGKRKNQSALVYVNDTPGKGEVGVDMKSIPTGAIERIEVLRDGASAQYGSDAIAGVINIILKERSTGGSIDLGTGITAKGDGLTYNAGINKGFGFGESGYVNVTASYFHQDKTNRAGEPGEDNLFGVDGTNAWIMDNPDLGMTIGQPEYDKFSGMVNFGSRYNEGLGQVYGNLGYTHRAGTSFALYRTPYWIGDDFGLLTPEGEDYNGFQPTFETTVGDVTATVGNKYTLSGWNTDISASYGSNKVDYLIGNSINVALGSASPTEFDPGGYTFSHILGNLDASKSFNKLTFGIGTEVRQETFDVRAGQEESYIDGGVQSFPGLQPGNALTESRTNFGVYASADFDATDKFMIGGAVRWENYSDFGSNLSWKANTRYILGDDKGAIRASVSTGFRAPSLHQIYLSNVQTLVSGGTVSNQGTFNNTSEVVKGLGVEPLDAEESFNYSAGLTYKLGDNFSFSADYYNISLDNRVLFTGEIGSDGDDMTTNTVEQILIDNSVTSIKFFVNAMDTKTQGFDLVADYQDISLGKSNLDLIFAFNYNTTEIEGQIQAPEVLANEGYAESFFSRKEQARVTSARPNLKYTLGLNLDAGSFAASLNNTYFGEVTWQHASDPSKDQTFGSKVLTDLILGYEVSSKLNLNLTVNNLFNVYPDVIETGGDVVTDLGGRFKYPWEVNQFGFTGMVIHLGANYMLK